MSLVNQPIVRKGLFVRMVDNFVSSGTGSFSAVFAMGTNTSSCSFATSTTNHISVSESGKYRVTFEGYGNINIRSSGQSIFSLTAGSQNVGIFYTEINTPVLNTFTSSRFFDYNATALDGSLPVLLSSTINAQINANCNISASADIFISSGELIRFNIVKTASTVGTVSVGLTGRIYLEQIS
jgi:hypothetical protein